MSTGTVGCRSMVCGARSGRVIVHRHLRFDRRVRTVWAPISTLLLLAAPAIWFVPDEDSLLNVLRIVIFAAGSECRFGPATSATWSPWRSNLSLSAGCDATAVRPVLRQM